MNNNQENLNNSPQINNVNNSMGINNNFNEPLNVIPQTIPQNNQDNLNNTNHQFDQAFLNSPTNNNLQAQGNTIANQNSFINVPVNNQSQINTIEEENPMLNLQKNKFLNSNNTEHNTTLDNLNVNGEYHDMPKIDYSQDIKVQENLKKRNTVTITGEGKIFIIIIIVLLIFVFVMPYIFDAIRNIRY